MTDTAALNATPTTAEIGLAEVNAILGEGDNFAVQPANTIRLTKTHHEAFLAIFDHSSRHEARRVTWEQFINAMKHVGFTVESRNGSIRKFKPPTDWNVTPVTFHRPHGPHMNGNLEEWQKRALKGKLQGTYGWAMSTFVVE
jgi:predicted RNA binding protein YcfA (HicA-like mRNA interferase family)